ncbi:hypothetical protein N7536_005799 [Penicillium majusculum]|nr:hypothetical protein N7536_005799 [Penicillium majusculum]
MTDNQKTFTLSNGAQIPAISLGTYYGTEPAISKAIKQSGIPREEIFPIAFKRRDDPFPSNKDGKLITNNIDYLDISLNFDITFELEPIDIENIDIIDKKLRFNDLSKDFSYELYLGLNRKKK